MVLDALMLRRMAITGLALLGLALSGCQGPESDRRLSQFMGVGGKETTGAAQVSPPAAPATASTSGSTPASLVTQPQSDVAEVPTLRGPEIYRATGTPVASTQRNPVTIAETGEVTLNFVNADIREVVDVVLGQTLKVGFVIDPRVQGVITLRTTRPVPRASVIGVLEDVLAMNGAALEQSGEVYRIVPIEEAVTSPSILSEGAPAVRFDRGFGLHVIPLRYAAASALRNVVEPFVPPGRVLQVDEARNLMVFVGTGPEAKDIEDLIATFDVDWMADMSFGLFPLRYADAETIVHELERIFAQDSDGPLAGVVQFMPILRLNAVLVITPQSTYLTNAQSWITRLDRGQEGDRRQLYVYYVQNGRAAELAEVLGQAFGVSAVTAAVPEAPSLAPGLTPTEIGGGFSGTQSTSPGDSSGGTMSGLSGSGETGGLGTTQRSPRREPTGQSTETGIAPASTGAEAAAPGGDIARIVADARNNALVIHATAAEYQAIEAALQKLDIVPLQVLIEATIAEVSLNDTLRYGVEWFFNSNDHTFVFSPASAGAIAPNFPGFNYLFNTDDVKVVINALTQVTDVKVISSPQLMVLDNEAARLQVGDQVPITTRTSQSIDDPNAPLVAEIEYRDTGVILDIIPRVNASGLVVLDIIQEVSDVVATDTSISAVTTPTIQQRRIASTVAISSGETVALGGLIRDNNSNAVTGIPVLSEIPILGNLFKTTSDTVRRTELLVLLTPRVVRDRLDARTVTEDLRRRVRALKALPAKIQ
jgi:general secretion pathway protein D